ncbi:MAG: hypothetical protein LBE21_09735 [Pseudomonadales bacterium]|jgi:hypothetical protein|nr:hypothetical protein [Pseudomonadales bacterium]
MMKKLNILLIAPLVAATIPALAHHSFSAEFDANKEVRLEGTVVKMEWVNPHSWLHIAVVNEQGETEEWAVEGGSPGVLLRLGWTKDSLPPGAKIIVNGYAAKDGSLRANSRSIEFPDGRVLDAASSNRYAAPE